MDNYKIAYILTPVEFGGAERVSLNFLRHYRRDNFQIIPIILCRPWESENIFINELTKMGIDFRIIPTRIKPRDQGNDYFRVLRCGRAIFKELKKGKFNLVHTNGYFADILGVIAAKLLRIPIVATCHGFISNDIKLSVYNRLDIFSLGFMDQIITVSEQIRSDITKRGIKPTKIQVIQNAVECTPNDKEIHRKRESTRLKFKISPDEVVLGYVGRLSKEKGVNYFIQTGQGLLENNIQFRMLIIGDGPQKADIVKYLENHSLSDKVILAGFQKNISDILPAFDIFVLPSLTEGTSMALLEAMSCGLPVIATAVGGTPKVVDSEKNGILVPPQSPETIVKAIVQLLNNKSLMKKMGQAAAATVEENYSIESWLKNFDNLYTAISKVEKHEPDAKQKK